MPGKKPTVIKRLEGNRGKRPLPANEPIGKGRPRVPDYLSAEAAERYRDVVGSLPDELLTRADEATLERVAVAWATFREATRAIDAEGLTVAGQKGTTVRNPMLIVQKQAATELHLCAAILGLSPVARANLAKPDAIEADPLSFLLGDTPGDRPSAHVGN